jgi:SAM-dependent methyltransferase
MAAPRDPEVVLAATYGQSWATPDPSFKYKTPRSVIRHFERWVGKGGGVSERRGWDRYHEASTEPSDRPDSAFAEWVLSRLPGGAAVMDLGCGAGADACRYAAAGHVVLGIDYSPTAVEKARALAGREHSNVAFEAFTLLDLRRVLTRAARFVIRHPGPRAVTCRLTLDALPPDARNHVWWLSRTVLLGNAGSLFLEVRTHDGVPAGHRDGAPWQTHVSPQRVVEEVTAHGGRVEESIDVPPEEGGDGTGRTGTTRLRVSWPEGR